MPAQARRRRGSSNGGLGATPACMPSTFAEAGAWRRAAMGEATVSKVRGPFPYTLLCGDFLRCRPAEGTSTLFTLGLAAHEPAGVCGPKGF